MRIERAGEVQFNALGQPTRQTDTAGRVIHRAYDASGRPTRVADSQGYRQVIERDSEGRATYYWRDELGRAVGQLLPDGRLLSCAYDAAGEVTEQIDGEDIRHVFLRNAECTRTTRLEQAPDGAGRLALRSARDPFRDDFGRLLRRDLPDHGARSARYDAANRIVEIRQANGGRVVYRYDPAGRPVGVSYRNVQDTEVDRVDLRFEGHGLRSAATGRRPASTATMLSAASTRSASR